MAAGQVVKGLAESRQALRKFGAAVERELVAADRRATRKVAREARASASGQEKATRKLKETGAIRISRHQYGVSVHIGGRAAPWGAGAELGSKAFAQFRPYREDFYGGYAWGEAFKSHGKDFFTSEYEDTIDGLLGRLFTKGIA